MTLKPEDKVRKIVREEFARGIPEFMLQQASADCVATLRQHLKRFIATRADNPTHARELHALANSTLDDLDEEINLLIQDKLWAFLQQT